MRKKEAPYAPAIILRRFLLRLRWDYLIRNVLDRIVYLDWDLLGKEKREILSRHYSRLNQGLRPYFRNQETGKSLHCNGSGGVTTKRLRRK